MEPHHFFTPRCVEGLRYGDAKAGFALELHFHELTGLGFVSRIFSGTKPTRKCCCFLGHSFTQVSWRSTRKIHEEHPVWALEAFLEWVEKWRLNPLHFDGKNIMVSTFPTELY